MFLDLHNDIIGTSHEVQALGWHMQLQIITLIIKVDIWALHIFLRFICAISQVLT